MATTTKLIASNGYYGHSGNGVYGTVGANHLYVGQSAGTSDYRSRMSFPALSGLAMIGESRIRIVKLILYIYRNDGGPTQIEAGCSASSGWGAAMDAAAGALIPAVTGWHAVDLTALAQPVAGYKSKWFLHIGGESPRLRFASTGGQYKPYLMVTWEHVAATISGDRDAATLGADEVTFTITPETEGETHTLTYAIGDSEGVIAENAGNVIAWTPPLELAAEITQEDSAAVEIRMTAFGADGRIQRTEVYYQTVTVPESAAPVIADPGIRLLNGLGGLALSGWSQVEFAPVIDMNAGFGAWIAALSAELSDGQRIEWTRLTEDEPGIFSGAAARIGVPEQGGMCGAVVTVTDSRGRSVRAEQQWEVRPYSPPVITGFSAERYEPVYDENEEIAGYVSSDSGDRVWIHLTAKASEIADGDVQLNTLRWSIEETGGDGIGIRSGIGGAQIEMIGNREIFPDIVGEEESRAYTVTVTDSAGCSAVQYASVGPAHVNFSLSPDKWGVGVGMIAGGRKDNPRFEVAPAYQSHFHGGIYDERGAKVTGCEVRFPAQEGSSTVSSGVNADIVLFTAEDPGIYLACCAMEWQGNSSGQRKIALIDSGGTAYAFARQHSGSSGAMEQCASAIIPLNAGESILLRAWQNSGAALTVKNRSCQIARIGG